jgi:hypothetical protein
LRNLATNTAVLTSLLVVDENRQDWVLVIPAIGLFVAKVVCSERTGGAME